MLTATTKGIKISVESFYNPLYSKPIEQRYIFTYRITIENTSEHAVQLLSRHWTIIDGMGNVKEVQGEGVVGVQPLIPASEAHQYVSWANLDTDIGKMFGTYLMERRIDGERFDVTIPEFQLVVPFKMN